MLNTPATKLIACDIRTDPPHKWSDFIDGGNGCLYGIPTGARRVVEFKVEDKSMKVIGPDLGVELINYRNGIKAANGCIYCVPVDQEFFLKIIPGEGQNAEVQILTDQQMPRNPYGYRETWNARVLANDGCIYYFADQSVNKILKLDPSDDDRLSLVGYEIYKDISTAVLGNDGYIYGISRETIIKFSPTNHSVSYIESELQLNYRLIYAMLAGDGNIYATNQDGQILRIDMAKNDWKIISFEICKTHLGWGRPVLGADKCIYFPPFYHDRVLKFNPITQSVSLIGESYSGKGRRWAFATLASDGFIYCIPNCAVNILQIDSRHINEKVVEMIENLNVVVNRNDQVYMEALKIYEPRSNKILTIAILTDTTNVSILPSPLTSQIIEGLPQFREALHNHNVLELCSPLYQPTIRVCQEQHRVQKFISEDRILKLDPNDGDSLLLGGEEIDGIFTVAVLENDRCINGILHNRIIKFSLVDYSLS